MVESNYEMGKGIAQYRGGEANTITLILTEECNLRCHYCYLAHKNSEHVMSRKVAYRAIDFVLDMPQPKPGVVLELTGGEPTLEIDLLRDVTRYFRRQLSKRRQHPWHDAFMISVGTNGTTYCTPEYQRFLWENHHHVCTALTIDGIKTKHDMHRVFADGSGSFDVVLESAKLWLRQNDNATTKVTFASDDLPFLCESILFLWDMGFKSVPANVVFENVWKPGDPSIFEEQLIRLADIVIERGLWRTKNTTLFWVPRDRREGDDQNWCGTGQMMSIDGAGRIFPCLRFQDYSMSTAGRCGRPVGSIYDGFYEDVRRAFYCLRKSLQSPQMCIECPIDEMCSWCSGWNYDASESGTMFSRATYICEMHKAQWRANQYLWRQLKAKHGLDPKSGKTSLRSCPV